MLKPTLSPAELFAQECRERRNVYLRDQFAVAAMTVEARLGPPNRDAARRCWKWADLMIEMSDKEEG